MKKDDRKEAAARRGARLWKVLVAGGMALAAACAGMQKDSSRSGSSGSSGSSGAQGGGGGGAGGW